MGKCGADSVPAEAAEAAEERGAGASAEPSIVNSQFESVDGTVGPVGSSVNARFVGD